MRIAPLLFFVSGAALASPALPEASPFDLLASVAMGSGVIYAGGDPSAARTAAARDRLAGTLQELEKGIPPELCEARQCAGSSETMLCHVILRMNTPQRFQCREFVSRYAKLLRRSARDAVIRLSGTPLSAVSGGRVRSVLAMTPIGAAGPIVLHEGSLNRISETGLLALLGHELGHKIRVSSARGGFLTDDETAGAFARGGDWLDAVGSAIALFAIAHSRPPQEPSPLPPGVPWSEACTRVHDRTGAFLIGLALDFEQRVPDAATQNERLQRLIAGDSEEATILSVVRMVFFSPRSRERAARRILFRYLLREPQPEEIHQLAARLLRGDGEDSVVASVLGDPDYAASRRATDDAVFVRTAWEDLTERQPAPAELTQARAELAKYDRASWVLAFLHNVPTALERAAKDWYQSLLNRPPTTEEMISLARGIEAGDSWESLAVSVASLPEYRELQRSRFDRCLSPSVAKK